MYFVYDSYSKCHVISWDLVGHFDWNLVVQKDDLTHVSTTTKETHGLTIVYSTIHSVADQRKHQSSLSLAFMRGIHRWPVNSPYKWPVMQKMFSFDDVIMVSTVFTDNDIVASVAESLTHLISLHSSPWQNFPESDMTPTPHQNHKQFYGILMIPSHEHHHLATQHHCILPWQHTLNNTSWLMNTP